MTKTIDQKNNHDWPKRIVEWKNGDTAYLSVVFSWQLPQAYQRAVWLQAEGYRVRAGGPAVAIQPDYLAGVARIGGEVDALLRHNPNATFTSRGCIRRCSFCAVPRIEGDLRELADWEPRPVVCDNNLLACSQAHFDKVIDRLKPLSDIDFNQGLDARLMTEHHAQRLAELDLKFVRLAWDSVKNEVEFVRAYELLRKAGIAKGLIRVYVLLGFKDTPEDALYRLQSIRDLGLMPNPMRYQPIDATMKNSYVAPGWTDRELKRFVRYWSNLAHVGSIPFDEFVYSGHPRTRRGAPGGLEAIGK
jgi:hypothetical protein